MKRSKIYLMVFICTLLVLGNVPTPMAEETEDEDYEYIPCEMELRFKKIDHDYLKNGTTRREHVLQKVEAFYEGDGPTLVMKCDEDIRNMLKEEVLNRVYADTPVLTEEDQIHLRSLSPDLGEALDRPSVAEQRRLEGPIPPEENPCVRLGEALKEERISRKQYYIYRLKLVYAPNMIPSDSEFAWHTGDNGSCSPIDPILRDLETLKDDFTEEEKSELRSIDPSLKSHVDSWDNSGLQGGSIPGFIPTALPSFSNLDRTYEKANCIIHYTQNKKDPDHSSHKYVATAATYVEEAIANQSKDFRPAYPEGGGKLHIYCRNLSDEFGNWTNENIVPGAENKKSGYMQLDNDIPSYPLLKGAINHEYFHGVTAAYNYLLHNWFQEGSAMWAQSKYGGDDSRLGYFYEKPSSVFNLPNENLWYADQDGYRPYSTSTLVFFLAAKYNDPNGNPSFIRSILDKSDTAALNDAVKCIQEVTPGGAEQFKKNFKEFLASLYAKKVTGIEKYMPDTTLLATYNAYGVKADGNVKLLGANYCKLEAPSDSRLQAAPLVTILQKGTTGNPEGLLVKTGETVPVSPVNGRSYIEKADVEAVFIASDADYEWQDPTSRPYNYSCMTPYVEIKSVTSPVSLHPGETAHVPFTYDLLGAVAGELFAVTFEMTEYDPTRWIPVIGDYLWYPGENKSGEVLVGTLNDPRYIGSFPFTFQLRAPSDTWNIPQTKSDGSFILEIE
ncbi:MAG: hypothetical protein AB2L11_13945 [Syntrophobacteraceae bacterium]